MDTFRECCLHSDPIDPRDTHPRPDEYFGDILPLHISRYANVAEKATENFLVEWNRAIKADGICDGFEFHACQTPVGDYTSWSYPESPKDRLTLCTEISNFAFFWDDVTDAVSEDKNAIITQDLAVIMLSELEPGSRQLEPKLQISKLAARILRGALQMDRPKALVLIDSWKAHLVNQAKSMHNIMSFEEYKLHRLSEVGANWGVQLGCWSSDIDLTIEEKRSVADFVDKGMIGTQFVNDYYSFSKEFTEHKRSGTLHRMQNGIGLLMREYGYTEEEARGIIKQEIVTGQQAMLDGYLEWERTGASHHSASRAAEIRRYIAMTMFICSGGFFWTSFASRYGREDMQSTAEERATLVGRCSHGLRSLHGYPLPRSATCLPKIVRSGVRTGGPTSKTQIPRMALPSASTYTSAWRAAPAFACEGPYNYIDSLQGKKFRNKLVDALNTWLPVEPESLEITKRIVQGLHNSSLMLNDIEDGSLLRRGQPAAHILYGTSQTINSANSTYVWTVQETLRLRNSDSINIYLDELRNLHHGQSLDLYWRFHHLCPSIDEYIIMVDNKTGVLFRLMYRLAQAESESSQKSTSARLSTLMTLCGRYYQIHNDYTSLASPDYTTEKGFCEDLDAGKFSLPLIHLLNSTQFPDRVTGMLFNRLPGSRGLTREAKMQILQAMDAAGTFAYVRGVLEHLHATLLGLVADVEAELGPNPAVRVLLLALKM